MSLYDPTRKREDDKVYISEESGSYYVYVGREEKFEAIFETGCVLFKDEDPETRAERERGLWVILEHIDTGAVLLYEKFSSLKPQEAWQKAHDLALERAMGKLSSSEMFASFPVHHPGATTPTRDPNYVTLKKIIDNSRAILNRENSELVEYTTEPVTFVL